MRLSKRSLAPNHRSMALLLRPARSCRVWQCAALPKLRAFHSSVYSERRRHPQETTLMTQQRQQAESGNAVIKEDESGQWTAVLDKPTGQTYWWNKQSGETTALGEPKPGPLGRRAFQAVGQPVSLARAMISLAAMGAGVGLVFGIIGRIF